MKFSTVVKAAVFLGASVSPAQAHLPAKVRLICNTERRPSSCYFLC
jgi:hypothetical protein